jgi:tetratricopeptide (TPR) repeat protein
MNPSCHQALFWKGKALAEQGSFDAAVTAFTHAIELSPKNSVLYDQRGQALASLELFRDAIQSYDQSLELEHRADVFAHKGIALAELGMFRDAIESFDKAIDQNENLAEAWMGKGNAFYDLGKYTSAQAAYEKCLAIDPENAVGWTRHGMALSAQQQSEAAIIS